MKRASSALSPVIHEPLPDWIPRERALYHCFKEGLVTSPDDWRRAIQAKLEQLYGDVDNIDLWVGGLAEDHVRGSEELGEGDSSNNASNCSRAAGGRSPFFRSASSSARSFGLIFPGCKRRSFAP